MKIIIAGDFCPQGSLANLFEKNEFANIFSDVQDIIKNADYSIVNFECPVTQCDEEPILKSGPNLRCSKKGIEAIKWAGFKCVTLANNHFYDFGEEGVIETLNVCKENCIDVVGGGLNLEDASRILYVKLGGQTLALINCCEHEFSVATEKTAGSNPLNIIQQYYDIKRASKIADYIIVIVHGGHEHYNLPTPRMVETYRFFIDSGADVVINHHQHCFSGYELYNGKPIFYGLGNFCFDKISDNVPSGWNEGYMVELTFDNTQKKYFNIVPYYQCKDNLTVKICSDADYRLLCEKISSLNTIISDSEALKKKYDEWMEAGNYSFENQFLPYRNRWLISAYNRHLFPSFLSKEKIAKLLNRIECESHRERTLYALYKMLNR